ncbi:MAG: hypothetical protein R2941_11055 [Desulfobacterales bacterium]
MAELSADDSNFIDHYNMGLALVAAEHQKPEPCTVCAGHSAAIRTLNPQFLALGLVLAERRTG